MVDSIRSWSTTASNNATADGSINWQENQAPDTVNNSARAMMARLAELVGDTSPLRISGGSSATYTVTATSSPTTLPDGFQVTFYADRDCPGPSFLSVNSYGAIPLRGKSGVELAPKQILSGMVVSAYYKLSTNEWIATNTGAGLSTYFSQFQSADISSRIIPVGFPMAWPTEAIPSGWLELNGAAVSRATYTELFKAYGIKFGPGDGSTTFNLPDWRGEFVRGWDHGKGSDPDAATRTNRGDGTAGDQPGTKQASKVGPLGLSANSTSSSTATVSGGVFGGNAGIGAPAGSSNTVIVNPLAVNVAVNTTTNTTVSSSTSGAETRPRNVSVVWCCLALPAAAAAGALGVNGLQYKFDAATADADPGTGYMRANNVLFSSVTFLYISATDDTNAAQGATILDWGSSTATIQFNKVGGQNNFGRFRVSGAIVNAGTYYKIPVTTINAAGGFSTGDSIGIIASPAGVQGAGYLATSATNLPTVGTGSVVFTTQTGLAYATGATVIATSVGTSEWMAGKVTSYSGATLTVTMTSNSGSGTHSDWTLNVSGVQGPQGTPGSGSGTVTSVVAGNGLTGGTITNTGTVAIDLARVNAWTGQQYSTLAALTDGATIAWDLNTQQVAKVTLAGNRVLSNPTNMQAGSRYSLFIVQDATGGRTLAYSANYSFLGGVTPSIDVTPNAVNRLDFVSDGTKLWGQLIGAAGTGSSTSTAVTHTSSSVSAVATTAQKKLDREVNLVDDFGGVGDNATNNDTAYANFIAAANAGVPAYVPPGIFRVNSAAPTITPTGAFNLRGAGAKSIIRRMTNLSSVLLTINSATNPIIRDLTFDYAGATPYGVITGISQANPAVVTCSGGHPFTNGQTVVIYDVQGMTQVNGNSYIIAGATGTTFQLSGINSTGFTAYTSGGDVSLSNMGDHSAVRFNACADPFLSNVSLTGAWWVAAEMRDCDGGTYFANKVTNNGDRGLYLQVTGTNNCRKVEFIGNRIDGGGLMFYGINTNVASTAIQQDIVIQGNVVYNTVYQGIALSGASNGTISGNIVDTVSGPSGCAILIQTTNTLPDKFVACVGNMVNNAAVGICDITGQHNLISDNVINLSAANAVYAIQVSGSTAPSVTGNKIKSSVNNVVAILVQANSGTSATLCNIASNHIVMSGTGTAGISTDGTSTGNMAANVFSGPVTNVNLLGTWTYGDALALAPPSGDSTLQTVNSRVAFGSTNGVALTLNPKNGFQQIGMQVNGVGVGQFGATAGSPLFIQLPNGYNAFQVVDGTGGAAVSINSMTFSANAATGDTNISAVSVGTAADANVNIGMTAKGTGAIKVNSPLRLTNGLQNTGKNIAVPVTSGTVTLTASNAHQIINPAGTLAALTVAFPASPVDGQVQIISFTQIITALTLSGGTFVGGPTAIALTNGGAMFSMIFNSSDTKWYRCQ